jgi:predicted metal-dependent phosphoesterase TrpH
MFRLLGSLPLIALLLGLGPATAQPDHSHPHETPHSREITFPDIPGYETISTDLHIHTVFSDGSVWPDIRVQEGLKDELDAIAVTDHLEYQPHEEDIPHPDRNRSYEIANEQVEPEELLVINGSEVTRSMPPGHANAVFVEDANELLLDDPRDVFREADEQGAFIFWNHPSWLSQAPDGIPPLSDMHRELIDADLLHGIEVVNSDRYSKEALRIALEHDLTIMGTSDVHGLIDWDYDVQDGGHRPTTLVFSEDRSKDGLKNALFDGRTVVWKDNLLIGKEPFLVPLIEESLTVTDATYLDETSVLELSIRNSTGHNFLLENQSEYALHHNADVVTLDARSTTTLLVKTVDRLEEVQLPFTVLNAVTAPETHPEITLGGSTQ